LVSASVALFAVWMIGGAAWITARPADPMLWPARDERIIDVYLISNGYHAGAGAAAREACGVREPARLSGADRGHAALCGVRLDRVRLGRARVLPVVPTVGEIDWRLALRALFYSGNQSVVHVVGISGEPTQAFRAEMMKVPLSWNGFDQMLAKLDATFVPPQNGALPDLGRGLYGPSLFYPANGAFRVTRVCNHWIGDLLGAAGLPRNPVLATVPQGLMLNLRWQAGLRPVTGAQ
jgi:hypothetical protein